MLGIRVGIEQAYRQRLDTPILQFLQRCPDLRRTGRLQYRAVGSNAFVNLDDVTVQGLPLRYCQFEQLGTILVADLENIAKTPRRDESGCGPMSSDECVGTTRCAKSHRHGRQGIKSFSAKQVADRYDGRLFVGGQLVGEPFNVRIRQRFVEVKNSRLGVETFDRYLANWLACPIKELEFVSLPEVGRVAATHGIDDLPTTGACASDTFGDTRTEQFVTQQLTFGRTAEAIGECSAHVDPELPGLCLDRVAGLVPLASHGHSPPNAMMWDFVRR